MMRSAIAAFQQAASVVWNGLVSCHRSETGWAGLAGFAGTPNRSTRPFSSPDRSTQISWFKRLLVLLHARCDRLAVVVGLLISAVVASGTLVSRADDDPATKPAAPSPLAASQEAITVRYRRFEETLLQLSEYLRKSDPQRADLLVRAVGKSKEGRIQDQLDQLLLVLKNDQLGDAIEREEEVINQMQAVLELLMSEDRRDEIEQERARIKDLIKDVDKLIARQTDARVNTERGISGDDLERQQKQVADGAEKLVEKIDRQDATKKAEKQKSAGGSSADSKSGEKSNPSEDKDAKPDQESQPGEPEKNKKDDDDPSAEKDGKSGDSKQGNSQKNSPGKMSSSKEDKDKPDPKSDQPKDDANKTKKPDESDGSESSKDNSESSKNKSGSKSPTGKPQKGAKSQKGPQPQDQSQDRPQDNPQGEPQQNEDQGEEAKKPDQTPGRDEIAKARTEMERAIEELKKKRNEKASDRQDQALADLMKAKEKLEEILRQLREEERAMVLAALEARFRDMLQRQETVNLATQGIHAIPPEKRSDRHRNRSVELGRNEDEISLQAAKALTLLKEEGSSVAFPEAVEQIRDDMLTVARRLERADVGEITQNIEQDIVESLKEILEALQKELEKLKDQKQQQQQQPQQMQQQQPPLVNKLAELKMLRSLQYRVNRRTRQMGRLVDGEQALDEDVVNQLRQLSDRQAKVQRATHDLATGKNE